MLVALGLLLLVAREYAICEFKCMYPLPIAEKKEKNLHLPRGPSAPKFEVSVVGISSF
jgi:hypothetical protein